MILMWLILIVALGAIVAALLGLSKPIWSRLWSLVVLIGAFIIVIFMWAKFYGAGLTGDGWYVEARLDWIPRFGIGLHFALDGLSLLFVTLTVFLGIVSVVVSWDEIVERVGLFHFYLLLTLAGILGVFLAIDLFAFYFFWEVMLIPMYFLIAIWGHENRRYASMKFFIFTQAGGLLMLISIIGLYFIHGQLYTFEMSKLAATTTSAATGMWLMLGFFAAFGVKLPVIGLHTWLPDAHTQAPTAGSIILAGLLLKTGGYGFIRFILLLFPDAAHTFAPVAMVLGTAGILYGAATAFAQVDFKRYVALTSVSHLGFVLLGVFSGNHIAMLGAVVVMLAHGLSTGALFAVAGMLQQRLGTRDITSMGGLLAAMPRMGGVVMFFAIASLGLPGLGNFIGEFLVLAGTFAVYPAAAIVSSFVLVLSVIYSLWLVYRAFQGPVTNQRSVNDLNFVEMGIFSLMMVGLLWIGLYPRPVLKTVEQALMKVENPVQIKTVSVFSPGPINDKELTCGINEHK